MYLYRYIEKLLILYTNNYVDYVTLNHSNFILTFLFQNMKLNIKKTTTLKKRILQLYSLLYKYYKIIRTVSFLRTTIFSDKNKSLTFIKHFVFL